MSSNTTPAFIALMRPMAAKKTTSEHPTIGRLLRSLRTRNNWTLKEMSKRSGIPLSTLAKVEHDRLTLTYDKLQMLSQRLKIPMTELFAEPSNAPEPAVTARRSIGRLEDAIRVSTPNYDYHYLCPELRRKRMIPVFARARAKSLEEFGELVRHSGEEYTYVLEGRVAVHTEFYDPIVLEVGESVYIDSNMGHAYLAHECDEAIVLCVCSSPDESLLESLLNRHNTDGAALLNSSRVPPPSSRPSSRRGRARKARHKAKLNRE
jgi:transcriptional regulator with XRE-family HTH domain